MKKEYTSPTLTCKQVRTNELICTSTIPGGSTTDNGDAQGKPRGASDWDHYEQ